jgi:hypothetical protein
MGRSSSDVVTTAGTGPAQVAAPEVSSEKPQELTEMGGQSKSDLLGDTVPEDSQAGVRAVEAAATVWTKWHLVAAYVMYALLLNTPCMQIPHASF